MREIDKDRAKLDAESMEEAGERIKAKDEATYQPVRRRHSSKRSQRSHSAGPMMRGIEVSECECECKLGRGFTRGECGRQWAVTSRGGEAG